MKIQLSVIVLVLGSVVLAAWTPAQESDAAKQLDVMAQKALNATLALLDSDVAAAKAAGLTPNCTRDKLQYRVELYVTPMIYSFLRLIKTVVQWQKKIARPTLPRCCASKRNQLLRQNLPLTVQDHGYKSLAALILRLVDADLNFSSTISLLRISTKHLMSTIVGPFWDGIGGTFGFIKRH